MPSAVRDPSCSGIESSSGHRRGTRFRSCSCSPPPIESATRINRAVPDAVSEPAVEHEYRVAEYEYRVAEYEYRVAEYEYRVAEYE